jgi:hypothetical protein
MKLEFSRQIFEKYVDFMEICQTGAECSMRTDGHDEANSLFRNYANAPKKDVLLVSVLLCSVGFRSLVVPSHISCVCECGIYMCTT